jgi:hypothetical protein
VRPVEAWRARSAAKAFYSGPPPDGSRQGIFYINLYDMKAAPKYQLAAILYHEAIPGHHVETVVAYELPNLPKFRKFASVASFSEGWGLYSERLAKEMGLYQDPYQDFGRLSMALMRATRLVVDTGIHSMKWTRAKAIDYLDATMPSSHYDNQREVERYIVLPGQATSYMVGMLKIIELRDKARAQLGPRFDVRAFHDTVLGSGPLPLPVLEQVVDRWMSTQASKPPAETTPAHYDISAQIVPDTGNLTADVKVTLPPSETREGTSFLVGRQYTVDSITVSSDATIRNETVDEPFKGLKKIVVSFPSPPILPVELRFQYHGPLNAGEDSSDILI